MLRDYFNSTIKYLTNPTPRASHPVTETLSKFTTKYLTVVPPHHVNDTAAQFPFSTEP